MDDRAAGLVAEVAGLPHPEQPLDVDDLGAAGTDADAPGGRGFGGRRSSRRSAAGRHRRPARGRGRSRRDACGPWLLPAHAAPGDAGCAASVLGRLPPARTECGNAGARPPDGGQRHSAIRVKIRSAQERSADVHPAGVTHRRCSPDRSRRQPPVSRVSGRLRPTPTAAAPTAVTSVASPVGDAPSPAQRARDGDRVAGVAERAEEQQFAERGVGAAPSSASPPARPLPRARGWPPRARRRRERGHGPRTCAPATPCARAVAESTPMPLASSVGRAKTAAPIATRPAARAMTGGDELTDSPDLGREAGAIVSGSVERERLPMSRRCIAWKHLTLPSTARRRTTVGERVLRGSRLGAVSYETDRGTEMAARQNVTYDCPVRALVRDDLRGRGRRAGGLGMQGLRG